MSQEKIKNRIDYKILSETLSIQTKYGQDEDMLSYIRSRLSNLDVTVQEDSYGNIYATKGTADVYPCVVAHTDTVQSILANVNIFRSEDTIFAFDPIKRVQHGIGGDDKVGVYITLQLLTDLPTLKAVFFRDEEIGCRGSSYSITNHKDWYADCGYVLMADRRGNKDVITLSGGIIITSEEFMEACNDIYERYSYEEADGIFTDVDTLTAGGIGISTVNLSCGYFEPHTSREVVSFNDVNRCYNLMYDIVNEVGSTKFAYVAEIPVYKKKYSTKYTSAKNAERVGASTPILSRQTKLFPPLEIGVNIGRYDNFIETDIIKGKKKIYAFKGVRTLSLVGETTCRKCNSAVLDNVFYLPYEGRMFCTQCNEYIDDELVNGLLQFLEVEDRDDVFVYSVYSSGWIHKKHAVWDAKLTSWVDDGLPF
jgi:tripeptide aminopeptidase